MARTVAAGVAESHEKMNATRPTLVVDNVLAAVAVPVVNVAVLTEMEPTDGKVAAEAVDVAASVVAMASVAVVVAAVAEGKCWTAQSVSTKPLCSMF